VKAAEAAVKFYFFKSMKSFMIYLFRWNFF